MGDTRTSYIRADRKRTTALAGRTSLGALLMSLAAASGLSCGASAPRTGQWVYQTGPIKGLLEGIYEGATTCTDLKKHGDFGLGTFHALDGEMVVLDGRIYQIRDDGSVSEPAECTSPFATVTFFRNASSQTLPPLASMQDLERRLDVEMRNMNGPAAIRIDGIFRAVTARVAPRQSPPYVGLAQATQHQRIFKFDTVRGTVVGFRFPKYLEALNAPGYHLHFVSDDRQKGGHLLALQVESGRLSVQTLTGIALAIPEDDPFKRADFTKDTSADLEKAERARPHGEAPADKATNGKE